MPIRFHICLISSLLISHVCFSAHLGLSAEQLQSIGNRIFANECASKKELLVFWNPAEPFPSLGIGHFIWLTAHNTSPFTQTFPDLVRFLQQRGTLLPEWVTASHCPWNTRAEFEQDTPRRDFLITLLSTTIPEQTAFIMERFTQSQKRILAHAPASRRAHVRKMFKLLLRSEKGTFALLDYLNFKGEGINPAEQYEQEGWGLLQVLHAMPAHTSEANTLTAFRDAAEQRLRARVLHAPATHDEKRFLQGWINRINRYL